MTDSAQEVICISINLQVRVFFSKQRMCVEIGKEISVVQSQRNYTGTQINSLPRYRKSIAL